MVTTLQKRTAEAVVNIFETGLAFGDYARVTLLSGDAGHLTYGRSQTTLASGNLFLLISAYVSTPGVHFADRFTPYLARLRQIDLSLDHDSTFRGLLEQAGSDPVMHAVQDQFFDRVYWTPAATAAAQLSITSALGCCVLYDSTVHGSWRMMRDRTNTQFGTPDKLTENIWIQRYISVRRDWLGNNPNPLLQRTVYRMTELGRLATAGKWGLDLPIAIRGVTIDESVLEGPPVRVSAQIADERLLSERNPMMQGSDVRDLQQALNRNGAQIDIDGVFGPGTAAAVRAFQRRKSLSPDGVVGPATRSALGL